MKIKDFIIGLISQISRLFPKRKNLWLFGAWAGRLYSDNPKYLFEYVNRAHPEIKALWITREKRVCDRLKETGFDACMRFSVKGLFAALRAEAAFIISGEKSEISPLVNPKRTKVIQLWHGVGPKAHNWIDKNGNTRYSGKNIARLSSYYWMAASEKNIEDFNVSMGIPKERFYITGYPRNDTFVTKPESTAIGNLRKLYSGARIIMYMPTHRNFGAESISIEVFLWLDKELADNNLVMVYKPHFHELKHVMHYESKFHNIVLAKDQNVWGDPYEYIHDVDLLISDYSSIIYDFLCSGKPIVLYNYDLEKYKTNDSGLCDYYESIPLGPFCNSWSEVMKNVVLLLENDTWQERRKKARGIFHPFDDGCNSERVFNTVVHNVLTRQ